MCVCACVCVWCVWTSQGRTYRSVCALVWMCVCVCVCCTLAGGGCRAQAGSHPPPAALHPQVAGTVLNIEPTRTILLDESSGCIGGCRHTGIRRVVMHALGVWRRGGAYAHTCGTNWARGHSPPHSLTRDPSLHAVHVSNSDIGDYIIKNASQYRALTRLQGQQAAGGADGSPTRTMQELVRAMRSTSSLSYDGEEAQERGGGGGAPAGQAV